MSEKLLLSWDYKLKTEGFFVLSQNSRSPSVKLQLRGALRLIACAVWRDGIRLLLLLNKWLPPWLSARGIFSFSYSRYYICIYIHTCNFIFCKIMESFFNQKQEKFSIYLSLFWGAFFWKCVCYRHAEFHCILCYLFFRIVFHSYISYLIIGVEAEESSNTKRKIRKGKKPTFAKVMEVYTILYLPNQRTIWLSCEVESFN